MDGMVRLRDGRHLAYRETGPADGVPMFFMHGTPGCRLDGWGEDELSASGVRQVSAERPGFGESDLDADRSLLGWGEDVRQLADALDVERFVAVGGSGGAAHALACGAALGDRVTAIGLLSPGGPYFDHPELATHPEFAALVADARRDPAAALARQVAFCDQEAGRMLGDPDGWVESVLASMEGMDRELAEPFVREQVVRAAHAFKHGAVGWALDFFIVVARPWGFDPAELLTQVDLWAGDEDPATSAAAAWLAANLPRCSFHLLPHRGHSVDVGAAEFLGTMVAAHRAAPRS